MASLPPASLWIIIQESYFAINTCHNGIFSYEFGIQRVENVGRKKKRHFI